MAPFGSPVQSPMWMFGLPGDSFALTAAALGVLLLVSRKAVWPLRYRRIGLALLMLLAAGTSYTYFQHYLGGSPRIIDATTYLFQARSLALGSFSLPIIEPTGSFRGRFLIPPLSDPQRLAGIFPAGYPALLALGVKLGSFQLVGPALAAALVALTYALAHELTGRRRDALVAATLSALCGALRYHTADTMSHGLSSLLTLASVYFQLRLLSSSRTKGFAVALGLSLGLLLATRQLTALAVTGACLFAFQGQKTQKGRKEQGTLRLLLRSSSWIFLGFLPGLFLLGLQNHAVTGDAFFPLQLRYYALSDGPPDCFGIGFGKGCHYEHADVVLQQGGQGLTPFWALKNTLHRLHWHSLDVANFECLWLLSVFFAFKVRQRRRYKALLGTLVVLPFAYSLFYFNGSYPGAGARFFAELIPLWHVLLALGLSSLRKVRVGLALSLLGFACHASFGHQMLAGPQMGPSVLNNARLEELLAKPAPKTPAPKAEDTGAPLGAKPLILFSTAHQFNATFGSDGSFFAGRRTRDSREFLLSRALGASALLALEPGENGPQLVPVLTSEPKIYVFESEFDYPPLSARDLWASPAHHPAPCVSNSRALLLHRTGALPEISLEAPAPQGTYLTELYVVKGGECHALDLGEKELPQVLKLGAAELDGVSHIDRLVLTPTHLGGSRTPQ